MDVSWQLALAEQQSFLESVESRLQLLATETAPPKQLIMRAFELPIESVRVLILGQDPYPSSGDAIGLAFAVPTGAKTLPRSLQNILKELKADLGDQVTTGGDLSRWSEQGVFLLNRHLTTALGVSGGHLDMGWAEFTEAVIRALANARPVGLVAVLWGAKAGEVAQFLPSATVIQSAHPSPLSARRGFFGSRPFSKVNAALEAHGFSPIDWSC